MSGDSSKLDFSSADFDPLVALGTRGLQPPRPAIRALNNIAQCRALLDVDGFLRKTKEKQQQVTNTSKDKDVREKAVNDRVVPHPPPKVQSQLPLTHPPPQPAPPPVDPSSSFVQKIAGIFTCHFSRFYAHVHLDTSVQKSGPLSVLATCLSSHRRIRVVVRGAHDMRGIATGFAAAFDRHFNLVLRDVEECFVVVDYGPNSRWSRALLAGQVRELARDQRIGLLALAPTKSPHGRPTKLLRRHVPQLFLRGDNIVTINAC